MKKVFSFQLPEETTQFSRAYLIRIWLFKPKSKNRYLFNESAKPFLWLLFLTLVSKRKGTGEDLNKA